eukprot:298633-Chlamydomonas_euryale.AAC.3
MLVSASGLGLSCIPRPRPAFRLGRRDRPRPAASTHVSCTDLPASVSKQGKRSGPLMHILHARPLSVACYVERRCALLMPAGGQSRRGWPACVRVRRACLAACLHGISA